MAALIKLAANSGIHLIELVFWRQVIALPVILSWAMLSGGLARLATKRPLAHAARAGYGLIAMMLSFGGLILLPLAEATTLGFAAPIFAVLLSAVLLKENVGLMRWCAVLAGFTGVVIIAQPGSDAIPLTGALVALGGAFMVALISTQIRDLSQTDTPPVIVFWFCVCSVAVLLVPVTLLFEPYSPREWLLLLGLGLTGTLGQLLITIALRFGQVSSVMTMDYSSLLWAAMYGWLLFDTLPTNTLWLGAPMLIAAGMVIVWRETIIASR